MFGLVWADLGAVLDVLRVLAVIVLVLAVLGMRRDIRRAIGRHKP